jgi:cytidylate kinase
MYRVITVAREYGSGGGAIAKNVAERLNWKLLDRNLIAAIARSAQVDTETARRYDESVDSWWHRLNRGGLWSASLVGGASVADAQFFDAESMAALANELITGSAVKGGCVIVGRGGQCVLEGRSDVLNVFVYAPWEQRIARVKKRVTDAADIGELLRSTDRTRATYIRRYFGRDWKDPHLYQMMINSELGEEEVASLVVGAIAKPNMAVRAQPCGS